MTHGPEGFSGYPPRRAEEAAPPKQAAEETSPARLEVKADLEQDGDKQSVSAERGELPEAERKRKAWALVDEAHTQRNFSPADNLAEGRMLLSSIANPTERSATLKEYAEHEIARDFAYDAMETIRLIENPQDRFAALYSLHDYYESTGSRTWSPGEILAAAEDASKEMGEAGTADGVLANLAEIAASYDRETALAYGRQIRDPHTRAELFLNLADEHALAGRPQADYLAEARKAEER